MKEDKYVIMCRYEHIERGGKEFTKWFVTDASPRTLDDAEARMKKLKADCKELDSKTKLKHEYSLKPHSEYVKEIEDMRESARVAYEKYQEYKKSDEYKAIQKRKRQEAKELKERQKRYAEEHGKV